MSGKRRPPGDGSVFYDRSRGVWVGVVDLGRDPETRRRVRRKVSGATRTEAKGKLDALRAEKRRRGTVGRQDTTVERIVRDLLENAPGGWRSPITVAGNAVHAQRIIDGIGKTRLVSLTASDVERFLRRMVKDGYSTSTITATRGVLALAIRRAQRDGQVGQNVAVLADLPEGTRRRSRSMTLEQVRDLFRPDLSAWWRAYLLAGITLGLRPGELLGLTWDDVDFGAGVIRVRHSVKNVPGPDGRSVLVLADLKTARSRRTLALPAIVAAALRALKTAQAADKLRLGRYYTDNGVVFCGSAGQLRHRQNVAAAFKALCDRAGITPDWHPHELRHTFVSVLSDAGVDIEDIADAAGHINSNVTRTVYRHQLSDKVTRAAEVMDQIFGTGGGA